jgi:alpha-beta hydrolase superfamily lysophospholipase
LLLTSGTLDHTVPRSVTVAVNKLYADNTASVTDYHEYEGKGHSLTIDSGWIEVADDVLAWLAAQGYVPTPAETAETADTADTAEASS